MNCFACGEYIGKNDLYMMIDGDRIICHKCELANTITVCDNCGVNSINSWMDYITHEDDDDGYSDVFVCPTCYKEHYGRYPHDYKPNPVFHSLFSADRKYCLHIGVELELESNDYDCNKYTDAMNNVSEDKFYLKMDGSLSDECGAETISNPMTLGIALKEWKKVFQIINKYNMCSNEDTGLHFHLDKEYLNERQIRNIDYIVNTFTDSIKKLGGRDIVAHRWASQLNKSVNDWGIKTDRDYKFNAVNFTDNTIELRCFNATDDWFEFRFIMIAVFALAELAKIHKFSYFTDMTDNDFWLTFNKFIKRYIEKNNITE